MNKVQTDVVNLVQVGNSREVVGEVVEEEEGGEEGAEVVVGEGEGGEGGEEEEEGEGEGEGIETHGHSSSNNRERTLGLPAPLIGTVKIKMEKQLLLAEVY